MAVQNVILDSRVHRTIWLTKDETSPINIVADTTGYLVYLMSDGTTDTVTIIDPAGHKASYPCTNTYKPPLCGSVTINQVVNNNVQFQMGVDDALYRIIELDVNWCKLSICELMAVTYYPATAPGTVINALLYQAAGRPLVQIPDGGLKQPPHLDSFPMLKLKTA